ncbi:MAG: hypothetical protein M1818_008191 [Claussenomyces sp. TS43310]|nr:MAG: hypothetical protein M1818_008191 [Claussenomyces sp. TS43310]
MAQVMQVALGIAKDGGQMLLNHTITYPKSTAVTVINVAMVPILGPAWMLALPLRAVGFGSLGVVAGSIAASIQATQYGGFIPAGGVFALLQYLGAVV